MGTSVSSAGRAITIVRWVARILSALFIILCLILFAGEGVFREPQSPPLTTSAILQLTIMGISLVGLALAWKWEVIGGSKRSRHMSSSESSIPGPSSSFPPRSRRFCSSLAGG
jgi:hypothetical protein